MKLFIVYMICMLAALCMNAGFAFAYSECPAETGPVHSQPGVPYLGGRQSPGDIVGYTWYDPDAHIHGHRIMVDSYGQAHIAWTWMDSTHDIRNCGWNARYTTGAYFGETMASDPYSGYVQIDVMPDSQQTVLAYHWADSSLSCIDIDSSNLAGVWPNDPKPLPNPDHLWPFIAVAGNGNIIMATSDYNMYDNDYLYVTTDKGNTWTLLFTFDSCGTWCQFPAASYQSNKAVFVHTQYITDQPNTQLDQDVWYMESPDGGITWGPHTNLTNYQPYPADSVRGYSGVDAMYDQNDNLHIVWEGRRVIGGDFYEASKIFHWDEINDTITVVSSPSIYYNDPGNWWIKTGSGNPGCHRMPADRPQLIVDPDEPGYLYCLWQGNDDPSDTSYQGVFNKEIFGSLSTDYGITWSDYTNLTNTRSPGAPSGSCMSEDLMTANPLVVNDSIYVCYTEDKNSGHTSCWGYSHNPIRCWVFPKDMITSTAERPPASIPPSYRGATIFKGPIVLPDITECRIFDITGRSVLTNDPEPGVYFLEKEGCSVRKIIKIR